MEETLTADQQKAEQLIREWFLNTSDQVFVLSGYAGTGKTYLLKRVVEGLGLQAGKEAVFVAPTGKAAAVLVKNGTPAGTIHSLIYVRDEDDFEVNEDGEIVEKTRRLSFLRKEKIGEGIRLIVVDEASMVDNLILRDLLSYGVKCLFCGDDAQLPPVNGENVLLKEPDFRLTQIVRQERDNPIIALAQTARQGGYIDYGNYGDKVLVAPRDFLTGEDRKRLFLRADQILVGCNRTRERINREMRGYQGLGANPLPSDGEKVICTLNNWTRFIDAERKFNLVNGVIGYAFNVKEQLDDLASMDFQAEFLTDTVRSLPFDSAVFTRGEYAHSYGDFAVQLSDGTFVHENNFEVLKRVRAKREEPICRFEFAYAVTCHKAQGSEFDFVIVFDESGAFGEDKNRWLYTAITRAKKKLLVIR